MPAAGTLPIDMRSTGTTVILWFGAGVIFGCDPSPGEPAEEECDDATKRLLVEPATEDAQTIEIRCSVTLDPSDVITKRVQFGHEASGATFDCNGATIAFDPELLDPASERMLVVYSTPDGDTWIPPHDITIRNCIIYGSIGMKGLPVNDDLLRAESREPGYVGFVRSIAPTRITLDNLDVRNCGGRESCESGGSSRDPSGLYLHQGVNHVTVQRSTFSGRMPGGSVYLTSETSANVFRDNDFQSTSTGDREQVSIDGSDHNRFVNNRFAELQDGGIYIYRNCGENGFLRHTMPTHNEIINNVFYYNRYTGPEAAVLFGGRGYKDYCPDDWGSRHQFPTTSAGDDRNYARDNVVVQNQIFVRSVDDMIRTGEWPFDGSGPDPTSAPNTVELNATVTPETALAVGTRWSQSWTDGRTPEVRRAACWVDDGYKQLLFDGESLDVGIESHRLVCRPDRRTCEDGELTSAWTEDCEILETPFGCVGTTNAGCAEEVACPAGTRVVGAAAACNLETGSATSIDDDVLARVGLGTIEVARASDNVSDGACVVGGTTVSTGIDAIRDIVDGSSVEFACHERDATNPGECQIRGVLYCR